MPAPLPPLNLLPTWQPTTMLARELLKCQPIAAMLERGSAPREYAKLMAMQSDLNAVDARDFVYQLLHQCLEPQHDPRYAPMPRSHWLQWLAKQNHFIWTFQRTNWSTHGEYHLPQNVEMKLWELNAPNGSTLQYAMRSSVVKFNIESEQIYRQSLAKLPLFACICSDAELIMPSEGNIYLHLPISPPQKYKVVCGLAQDKDEQLESIAINTSQARKLVFAFVQRM